MGALSMLYMTFDTYSPVVFEML
jgi:hypothetical protein